MEYDEKLRVRSPEMRALNYVGMISTKKSCAVKIYYVLLPRLEKPARAEHLHFRSTNGGTKLLKK